MADFLKNNNLESFVKSFIEKDINPALAEHTGHVRFESVEDCKNVIIINLTYNAICYSCDSNKNTSKMIENFLQEEINSFLAIRKRVHVNIVNEETESFKRLLMD